MRQFKNEESLKAFLKSESKRLGISISKVYSTYFSRLLMESLSKYNNQEVIVNEEIKADIDIERRKKIREEKELLAEIKRKEAEEAEYALYLQLKEKYEKKE